MVMIYFIFIWKLPSFRNSTHLCIVKKITGTLAPSILIDNPVSEFRYSTKVWSISSSKTPLGRKVPLSDILSNISCLRSGPIFWFLIFMLVL
jgi:hypothetical protein